MLSKELVERLLKDETKSLLRAFYNETKEVNKIFLQHALRVSNYEMLNTIKDPQYFFSGYRKKLKDFLMSGQWLEVGFHISPIFRFLVFLGLPEDILLESFIYIGNLSREKQREFFILFLYEIWKKLRKEEKLLNYLIKNYEILRRKHLKL